MRKYRPCEFSICGDCTISTLSMLQVQCQGQTKSTEKKGNLLANFGVCTLLWCTCQKHKKIHAHPFESNCCRSQAPRPGSQTNSWHLSYEWDDFYGPLCTKNSPLPPHTHSLLDRLNAALLIYFSIFVHKLLAGSIKSMGTRQQDKHKSSASEFSAWAKKVFLPFFPGQEQRREIGKHFSPCESFAAFTLTSFHNDETAQRAFSFKAAINKNDSKQRETSRDFHYFLYFFFRFYQIFRL